jgi:lipopolysaccharide export system permease protein
VRVTQATATDASTARPSRRLGRRLVVAVTRELVFPTLYALLGFTVLAFAVQIVALADLAINRGLEVGDIAGLVGYQILPALGRSLPFATLVGALVGLGRLGADREILAMEAAGIEPARQLAPPVLLFASASTAIALLVSQLGAPWAHRGLDGAFTDLVARNPAASLRAGAAHSFGDFRIEAREVSSRGDELRSVLLWVPTIGETFFAERASVEPAPDGGTRVTLDEGILLSGTKPPAYLRFRHMQHLLPPGNTGLTPSERLAGAPNAELRTIARDAADPAQRRDAEVEWHRRAALPMATLWLAALAVPLTLWRSQASRTGGAISGIVVTLLFYALVQFGNGLLRRPEVSVALAVWAPIGVLVLVASFLWWRLLRAPRTASSRDGSRPRVGVAVDARADERVRRFALGRYVTALFGETALYCFLALLVAFVLGDLIDNLQWFAKYESTIDEVARFYTARVPVLAARVVPMALLVAAALTMSLLSRRGELTGMWACGISTLRAVRPILLVCALLAVSYHGLNNEIVPRANARASFLKQTEIKGGGDRSVRTSLWYRVGDQLYVAQRLDPIAGEALGVTVYELSPQWLPTSRTDAQVARHVGDGVWRLESPLRVEVEDGEARIADTEAFAQLGRDVPAEVDTAHLTLAELRHEIREVERGGYDATRYRVDLHQKLAAPLACLVLPALALLIATAGPPFWTPAQALVIAALQAVSYLVLSGVAASLGYGHFLPAPVAGWAPIGLVTITAAALAVRSRRQRG